MLSFTSRRFASRVSSSAARFASTLAVIEHSNGTISPSTFKTLKAAKEIDGSITALVAGTDASSIASQVSKLDGVSKILVANNASYDKGLAEPFADLIAANVKNGGFSHVFVSSSAFGKNVLPRVGAELDVQPISDIIKVVGEDTFVRPIYAGNVLATVKSSDPVKLVTVRASAFEAVPSEGSNSAAIEDASDPKTASPTEWISEQLAKSERPDLGSASKVVSGGRGLKDKAGFDKVIYPFADAIGAAVGASRAAVDSGFADNSLQVGQTGKVVAPELYIAVGISGAIQHLAGMKDSKTIAAINTDPEAPIFQVADYGLVEDLFKAVPELTQELKK